MLNTVTDVIQWLVIFLLASSVRDLRKLQRETNKELSSYFKLLAKMAACLGFGKQDL